MGVRAISPPLFGARKPPDNLPLDLRVYPGKFGSVSYDGDEMHNEQTNKQTFFFIYIDLSEADSLLIPS